MNISAISISCAQAQAVLRKQAREAKEMVADPDKIWKEQQENEENRKKPKTRGRGRGGRGRKGRGRGQVSQDENSALEEKAQAPSEAEDAGESEKAERTGEEKGTRNKEGLQRKRSIEGLRRLKSKRRKLLAARSQPSKAQAARAPAEAAQDKPEGVVDLEEPQSSVAPKADRPSDRDEGSAKLQAAKACSCLPFPDYFYTYSRSF